MSGVVLGVDIAARKRHFELRHHTYTLGASGNSAIAESPSANQRFSRPLASWPTSSNSPASIEAAIGSSGTGEVSCKPLDIV